MLGDKFMHRAPETPINELGVQTVRTEHSIGQLAGAQNGQAGQAFLFSRRNAELVCDAEFGNNSGDNLGHQAGRTLEERGVIPTISAREAV
jgi:hypothetical protein